MKEEMMNVEALSRAELLTLLSVLEGELEAQDVVIHTLRAQQRDAFIQERYGHYDLSDPFLALQRDSEAEDRQSAVANRHPHQQQQHQHQQQHQQHQQQSRTMTGPNPLAVLKLVMAHCKRMQERMLGQLTAAEGRHRKVIAELEEEKRRRALDAAQSDDFAAMMQTERDALLQQLETERSAVKRLEKERAQLMAKVEESLSQQEQLSSSLALELQRASGQAEEEAQKVSQLRATLQEESAALEKLRKVLETERSRAAQLEAKSERRHAEHEEERRQMKARICKEEERSRELEKQLEELRKRLATLEGGDDGRKEAPSKPTAASACVQTVPDGKVSPKSTSVPKVNGHHGQKETEPTQEAKAVENGGALENGGGGPLLSPGHLHPHSPSSTASSSLSSSPISSPVLNKRPGFHQSSYQAGVNQRFQAARHKFQSQAELDQQLGGPLSPRDLSPTAIFAPPPPEHSPAKQLARNTVTQVLSRFTSQQAGAKLSPISSSPFGTDYRSLASPTGGRSPSGPLSPGIRSPLTPRSEKFHPPPTLPKRPGMSPTPGSPSHSPRSSHFPELTGNCGQGNNNNNGGIGPEGAKEPDLVSSS